MTVTLNHTIVPARDKHRSATFLAGLLELTVLEEAGPFVPVRVNNDLTLDFDDRGSFHPSHYAFLVDDRTFDRLLTRLRGDATFVFGSGPEHGWDRAINHLAGGRGVYVRDPDGHSYEFVTIAPT